MTFAMDCPNFSLASLQKIVIYKNNNMCVSLNLSFNAPILSLKPRWDARVNGLFQPENIEEDQLACSTHKQEEIEADALDANLEFEK